MWRTRMRASSRTCAGALPDYWIKCQKYKRRLHFSKMWQRRQRRKHFIEPVLPPPVPPSSSGVHVTNWINNPCVRDQTCVALKPKRRLQAQTFAWLKQLQPRFDLHSFMFLTINKLILNVLSWRCFVLFNEPVSPVLAFSICCSVIYRDIWSFL